MSNYLVILSGGLVKDETGKWHTTLGNEGLENGCVLNDHLRIIAGAELWKQNEKLMILVSGGLGKMRGILPRGITLSSIMKRELIELGVDNRKILEDDTSHSTYGQLKSLCKIIESGQISGKISVLSNNYHLRRIKAIIDQTEVKKILGRQPVALIGAEDVLLRLKPKEWNEFIAEADKSESMANRLASEAKGVADIESGRYKFD